jgi:crotonobetainyl-CoA:carnitine CoA-transferase CaiB-like acyl-CoA transferase
MLGADCPASAGLIAPSGNIFFSRVPKLGFIGSYEMAEQIFSDVKVLDLTWYISGPYCTKIFADYGADVIKVETPGGGDPTRRMGPFLNDENHPEKCILFSHLNLNKRGITLNLKTNTGQKIIKELVKEMDILVESFSPGVMERLGLDYETLKQINPRLVMTSISNFGQTGPYRDYKLSELVLNGFHSMINNGEPERHPLKKGGNTCLYQGGLIGSLATLGALWACEEEGFGQYVDVSLMETQVGDVDRKTVDLLAWAYSGGAIYTMGNRHPTAVQGCYRCRGEDSWVNITITNDQEWQGLCRAMGNPSWTSEERFADHASRYENHDEFDRHVEVWTNKYDNFEIFHILQQEGVPAGPVHHEKDTYRDPHLNARGFFEVINHEDTGTYRYPGFLWRMSETPMSVSSPPCRLGEHNDYVFREVMGMSGEEISKLTDEKIIGGDRYTWA